MVGSRNTTENGRFLHKSILSTWKHGSGSWHEFQYSGILESALLIRAAPSGTTSGTTQIRSLLLSSA